MGNEFQTLGAEDRKAQDPNSVLCSVSEESSRKLNVVSYVLL